MQQLLLFLLKNALVLHSGLLFSKVRAALNIAATLSLPAYLTAKLTEWTISNQAYIAGVLTCIAVDHLVGSAYHAFKVRDFTFKQNVSGLITKLSLCAGAAALFEVIQHVLEGVSFVYDYLKITTRLMIILYPAGSAFLNMSALTNGVFPPLGWLKKIEAFNKNLDLKKINADGQHKPAQDQPSSS